MQPGDLIGEFTIVRQIGEGGMAIVCLAEHQSDRTQVVVKQLRDQLAFDRQLVERFAQSAQIMRELRHPHLARVIEYLERDGRYFVVEEYLAGGSLADLLDRGDPYPERDALCWCRDALRAVNYAHENGIVHRDLKPGNLMLDDQRRVKVTDFGIARVFGGPRLTRTGREMGTPTYMSPEQIRSPHQVDHLTDVYSMGVVLYELLTHRVPFDGESDFEIKSQVVRDPPVPPRQIAPSLSPRLEAIVLKAVAKEPADRFGGCAEFALELNRWLTSPSTARTDASTGERAPRSGVSWRRVIAATAVAVVGLAMAPLDGTPSRSSDGILVPVAALVVLALGFWLGRTSPGRGFLGAVIMGSVAGVIGMIGHQSALPLLAVGLAGLGGWLGGRGRKPASPPRDVRESPARAAPGHPRQTDQRVLSVENHPDYPALLRYRPSAAYWYLRLFLQMVAGFILLVFCVGGWLFVQEISRRSGRLGPRLPEEGAMIFSLILIVVGVAGVGLVLWGFVRLLKLSFAALRRVPAVVVDKRMSVSGGGQHSTVSTRYYVTVQLGTGERREFDVRGKLFGQVARDDAGVAYLRDRFLVGFRRLPQ